MLATVLDWFADPWAQSIGRRALAEVVLLGLAGGALGCWLVFYGLSYSAESLAHALLPGLVAAALLGLPLLLGGAAGLLAGAAGVGLAGRVEGVGRDTAVAVVVTTLFGLGVLLGEHGQAERVTAGVGPPHDLVTLVMVTEDEDPITEGGLGRLDPLGQFVLGRFHIPLWQR